MTVLVNGAGGSRRTSQGGGSRGNSRGGGAEADWGRKTMSFGGNAGGGGGGGGGGGPPGSRGRQLGSGGKPGGEVTWTILEQDGPNHLGS